MLWHYQIFYVRFLPILKIYFVFKLKWLKILKDPFREESSVVAPEISHILSFFYIHLF